MAESKKLRITVDSFERYEPIDAHKGKHILEVPREQRNYVHYTRGNLIVPADAGERADLLKRGVAEDPEEQHARRKAEIDRQAAQLEAERRQLAEQEKQLTAEQRAEKQQSSSPK